MKTRKDWLGMLVMVLVFGVSLIGCGGGLNGTWVADDNPNVKVTFNNGKYEIFERDNVAGNGTYTTSGNSITFQFNSPYTDTDTHTSRYSVSGNTLTLDDITYTRKQESKAKGGGGASSLVGRWVPESGQRVPSDFIERRVELLKDGTGIADGLSLTWTAEKSRIIVKLDIGQAFAYDYQVSGPTLILTNDDGVSVRYKKE